jgi:sporulation protein YlmC with PRC-barrel domain
VLRSVRELEKFKVTGPGGSQCGRIKDIYFDDSSWQVTHLVLSMDRRQFGSKQVLVAPGMTGSISAEGIIQLNLNAEQLDFLPLASSVAPVCKQYASFAYASPGARMFASGMAETDPHLRSVNAVLNFRVNAAGEVGGTLADFMVDDEGWQIRYLVIEQLIERKKLRFHILPQTVERFTWATQRLSLRELQPVRLDGADNRLVEVLTAA